MIGLSARSRAALAPSALLACLACASTPPGLDSLRLDAGESAILLVSYAGTNRLEPLYPPRLMVFDAVRQGEVHENLVVQDGTDPSHWPPARPKRPRVEELFYVSLEPGRYELLRIRGGAWPVERRTLVASANEAERSREAMGAEAAPGYFNFPFHASFEIAGGEVAYLGHLEVVNREASAGQIRSGSASPEPHQGRSGMSGGTMSVSLVERWERDGSAFRSRYPFLRGREIRTLLHEAALD